MFESEYSLDQWAHNSCAILLECEMILQIIKSPKTVARTRKI